MVKSESFELQARTERAWDSDKQPSDAGTVFGAVAGQAFYKESNETLSTARVHVEMTADRTTGTIRQLSAPSKYTTKTYNCSGYTKSSYISICMSPVCASALSNVTHSNM